jgi:hypothetical protein
LLFIYLKTNSNLTLARKSTGFTPDHPNIVLAMGFQKNHAVDKTPKWSSNRVSYIGSTYMLVSVAMEDLNSVPVGSDNRYEIHTILDSGYASLFYVR